MAIGKQKRAEAKNLEQKIRAYAPAGPIQLRAGLLSGGCALTLNDASCGEYEINASAISTASVMHKNPISSLSRLFPVGVRKRTRFSSAFGEG